MTSTCSTIQQQFSAYLDGEVNDRQHAVIDAHLADCAACRQEFEALRRIDAVLLVDDVPALRPQVEQLFAERLAARAATRSQWSPFFTGNTRLAWYGALAAVILFGIVCLLRFPGTHEPRSVSINQTVSARRGHPSISLTGGGIVASKPVNTSHPADHPMRVRIHHKKMNYLDRHPGAARHPATTPAPMMTDFTDDMTTTITEAPVMTLAAPPSSPGTPPAEPLMMANASPDPEDAAVAMLAETN